MRPARRAVASQVADKLVASRSEGSASISQLKFADVTLQRQQVKSVVDDWSAMTDEEKKRVLQMIFSEIRADHTVDGLKIVRPKPIWEPYVEAVLARQRQEQAASPAVTTAERKTGLEPATPTLARSCSTN